MEARSFEAQTVARDFTLSGRPTATLTAPSITSIAVGLESRPETTVSKSPATWMFTVVDEGLFPDCPERPGKNDGIVPERRRPKATCCSLEVQQDDRCGWESYMRMVAEGARVWQLESRSCR